MCAFALVDMRGLFCILCIVDKKHVILLCRKLKIIAIKLKHMFYFWRILTIMLIIVCGYVKTPMNGGFVMVRKKELMVRAPRLMVFLLLLCMSMGLVAFKPWCVASSETLDTRAYADTQGAWRYNSDQATWRYQDKSGSYITNTWALINNRYYCFDSKGCMRTGWIHSYGQWYYCGSSGAMVRGWNYIDGSWYYFASAGAMQTGWLHLDSGWYYLSSAGEMQTGWLYTHGVWYYLAPSGVMAEGWRNIDGVWYYFGTNGAMHKGWLKDGSSWYYLSSNGKAAQDWMKIGGAWYYFYPTSCRMAASQYVGSYWVNGDGAWDATQYNVDGLIQKVNQARAREGVPTLKWSASLAETAALRAREAADYFSHTRPNGESCFSLYPSGFTALGENLAAGPSTIEEAHQGWMNSPSHRACLLDKDFNVMGVACIGFDDGYNYYWVECFGHDPNV